MKRFFKIVLFCILMQTIASQSYAIERPTTLYVFGFSASFNDSTIYITEIQKLDSAWVNKRTGFLYSRESYSSQLKYYLQNKGVPNPTCMISFAKTQKDAEKKFQELRKKYTKNYEAFNIKNLTASEFHFNVISASDDPNVSTDDSKEALKAEKKAEKKAKKEAKQKAKEKSRKAKAEKYKHPQKNPVK